MECGPYEFHHLMLFIFFFFFCVVNSCQYIVTSQFWFETMQCKNSGYCHLFVVQGSDMTLWYIKDLDDVNIEACCLSSWWQESVLWTRVVSTLDQKCYESESEAIESANWIVSDAKCKQGMYQHY
jgi:hypothetical protein